jgi:hypothetical protein
VKLVQIVRWQVGIQPGFTLTSQSSQGKTILKVLADLTEGGFLAYVTASHAQSCYSLCILKQVNLNHLRRNLPFNLSHESLQLDALAHNTLVNFGLVNSGCVTVPDVERDCRFDRKQSNKFKGGDKCKCEDSTDNAEEECGLKMPKPNGCPTLPGKEMPPHSTSSSFVFPTAGCMWDSVNWSCTFDSVFMSCFVLYMDNSHMFCQLLSCFLPDSTQLTSQFGNLLHTQMVGTNPLNFRNERNFLRLKLYNSDPGLFPLNGHTLVSAYNVLDKSVGYNLVQSQSRPVSYCNTCLDHQVNKLTIMFCTLPTTMSALDCCSVICDSLVSSVALFEWLRMVILGHQADMFHLGTDTCPSGHLLQFTFQFNTVLPLIIMFEQFPHAQPMLNCPKKLDCFLQQEMHVYHLP